MKIKLNKNIWTIDRIIAAVVVVVAIIAVLIANGSKASAKKKYESQIKDLTAQVEELKKDNQSLLDLIKERETAAAEKASKTETSETSKNTGTSVTETGTVKVTIEKGFKGGWPEVAKRLASAGLIAEGDRQAFVERVVELEMSTKLQLGTYELEKTMTQEEMIYTLCNQ